MESILVTGGAGFIGSHTCLLLLKKGYDIFILDSFINSSEKLIEKLSLSLVGENIDINEKLNLIKGDIKNKDDIEKVFQLSFKLQKNIIAVIHFAGLKSVFDSILKPLTYWENNVYGTINLLKIMKKYKCKNIVFSSSAAVYQTKSKTLLNEGDACKPINPYGCTKLTIENILQDVFKSEPLEWRIVCLRYFNPIGAHEFGFLGEDPTCKPNNIFPQITKVAMGKLKNIKIFGSDWPTSDGTGVRDYIHVMDLAEGHLSALDYLINNIPQILTLNLGTGLDTTVLELINTFEKVNNISVPYIFENRRDGDNAYVVADNSLAKSVLNWQPKRDLEDMCRDGWNWQLKNSMGINN
tara:strand:+ start:35314 stop:36372 length:1059 start_codon:yes stop_codon:yes gene_type:complete